MRRVHFVGIGGIGMSGLAEILHAQGFAVSGSDAVESETTQRLRSLGIPIFIGHAAEHVSDADVVVYSSAVDRHRNPETLEAERRGIPLLRRAEMLAHVARLGKTVAIAGTHGKTTTTSLCGLVLIEAGFDPTVIVGGRLHDFGGSNARLGKGEWFVLEADEYDRSFLELVPTVAVITNVEAEHLDVYGTAEAVEEAFAEFAQKVPFHGAVIACGDNPGCRRVLKHLERRIVTYGFGEQCQLRAVNVQRHGTGSCATVVWRGRELGHLVLRIPGQHNVLNALAAIAVGLELDVPVATMLRALEGFRGVIRRFHIYGEREGVVVVDDYAHHPTEVRATLAAARWCFPERRIVAVFQPHTYTRTRDFAAEFAHELAAADVVVVTDVYAAREQPIDGVGGELIATALRQGGHLATYYAPTLADVQHLLPKILAAGDLLLTMGAGNILRIAQWYYDGFSAGGV